MMSLICEILKNDTNELTDKTEIDSNTANKFMVTKGKVGGRPNLELTDTLLYIK